MNAIQRPNFASLLQLAADARGQDWADDLSGGIAAATFAGWTWERMFLTSARLIIDPDASGRGLLHEVQDPARQVFAPVPPTPEWEAARAALTAAAPQQPEIAHDTGTGREWMRDRVAGLAEVPSADDRGGVA